MKKVLLLIGCLFIGITSANALTLNEDGTYTNTKGVKIASEQYKNLSANFTDTTINLLDQNDVLHFSDSKNKENIETNYTITTDTIIEGEIVDSITIYATESQAKRVAKNDNFHILSDMKLHDISEIPMPMYEPEGGYNATNWLDLSFVLHFRKNVGSTVYGSYQHASNSNITLAQAKSYSIQAGGLGNVIYFSNATVRKYYDGMQGVSTTVNFG